MDFDKKELKKFFKFFFIFYILFLLIFNWNKISWIFNYKALSLTFSRYFSKNKIIPSPTTPNPAATPLNLVNNDFPETEKEDSLEIPNIEIFTPIYLVESKDEKKILENLDRGPVMFSDYSMPSKAGPTIILGHSARHDWPKSNPAWVFTYLRDVKPGDKIILNFSRRKYEYTIDKTFILKKGEDIPLVEGKNTLFLITCWPPGRLSFEQRLVVEAKLNK